RQVPAGERVCPGKAARPRRIGGRAEGVHRALSGRGPLSMGAPRGRMIAGLMILPAALVFLAFFVLPLVRLVLAGGAGPGGWAGYGVALAAARHLMSLAETLLLSTAVTLATLVLGGIPGLFLARNRFRGRAFLVSILTLPLAFPGVVVGFMVILL